MTEHSEDRLAGVKAQLHTFARLCVVTGDMTPYGARGLHRIADEMSWDQPANAHDRHKETP